MSTTSIVARDLVAYLNAYAFGSVNPFVAAYSWMPELDVVDLDALSVTVHPQANEVVMADRSSTYSEYQVVILIAKRVVGDQDDDLIMDEPDSVANAIKDATIKMVLPNVNTVFWLKTIYDSIGLPDKIRENRQFTAVLTVTFKERISC